MKNRGFINILQEFSLPLLSGVVVAMFWANLDHESYEHVIHWVPVADLEIFGHLVTHHWLVNDIFMVFFFGIAAKEITESCLPGGNLNPITKSINPLLATLGGVIGPVLVFFAGMSLFYGPGDDLATLRRGWGIPTATDIALAWLVARTVFGKGHPAINFLLLLAVADDAIGLVIIAVFYGDPNLPTPPSSCSSSCSEWRSPTECAERDSNRGFRTSRSAAHSPGSDCLWRTCTPRSRSCSSFRFFPDRAAISACSSMRTKSIAWVMRSPKISGWSTPRCTNSSTR